MGRSGDPRKRAASVFTGVAWVGQGMSQHVTGERVTSASDRMDAEVREAAAQGRHYWQAIAVYWLSDDAARVAAGEVEGSPHLDSENLRDVVLGCYVCEASLRPELIGQRCPGDPAGQL